MFEPKYTITNEILKNISRIEYSRSIIDNASLIPSWERDFQNEAVVRAVHYSTHIEDNALSYKQVSQIVHGQIGSNDVRVRDYKEVVNYREVLKFIENRLSAKETLVLNVDLLLQIHKILTDGLIPLKYSGAFRKVPVVIMNSLTGEVSYRAPHFRFVEELVTGLFEWCYDEGGLKTHPVIKSGIIHTQIARIHPFVEANGRTSRVMATLSLLLDGYDIRKFFCLDEHYDRDLPRYYKALQSVEKGEGDMTDWLSYFSEGLAEELEKIKNRVLKLSRDSLLRRKVGQVMLTDRQEKILSFIQDNGFINNKVWHDIFPKFSDDTILRDLKVLIKSELVKKVGKTKSAKYLLKS